MNYELLVGIFQICAIIALLFATMAFALFCLLMIKICCRFLLPEESRKAAPRPTHQILAQEEMIPPKRVTPIKTKKVEPVYEPAVEDALMTVEEFTPVECGHCGHLIMSAPLGWRDQKTVYQCERCNVRVEVAEV